VNGIGADVKSAATIASLVIAGAVWAQPAPQTVLFVCEHGAAKSVVAAAHFNRVAAERGLPFRAVSRGTVPDPSVPGAISTGLENEGLAVPPSFSPALVTGGDVDAAARIVTFDLTLPMSADASRLTRWDRLPAFSDGYGPASHAIAARVEALVSELETAIKKR
jgi:arsenate reductase